MLAAALGVLAPGAGAAQAAGFPGFDRNQYPGDQAMAALRRTFSYTGYWLNTPPGAQTNTWTGRRELLRREGYGFLVLFNGRTAAQLKPDPAALGTFDGRTAASAAQREGFPAGAVLFLDQEEGGRLTPQQAAYIGAWVEAVDHSPFKPGVYASGIDVPDGPGHTISTALDLRSRFPALPLWVANDSCPPSPGCRVAGVSPALAGIPGAVAWQYAQSPRRPQFAARCAQTYGSDNNCYGPPSTASSGVFIDLDTAISADPSHGR